MIKNIKYTIVIYDTTKQMQFEIMNIRYHHKGNTKWVSKDNVLILKSEDGNSLTKYYFVSRYSRGNKLLGLRFDNIIELPNIDKDERNITLDMEMVYRRLRKEWKKL